jgi:nucleotide-binding universal stress UspA family protein
MPYKTILVHLDDNRRAEALLEPAVELATRYNSHLLALYVPAASVAQEAKRQENFATTFARMTANGAFAPEWRPLDIPHVDLAPAVMQHCRTADLIIVGQTDPDRHLSSPWAPQRLALESGRPVLVIPYAGRFPRVGGKVVIAWKPTRECVRAVFDALPILQGAENVHMLEVRGRSDEDGLAPDASIAASLARHGVKTTLRTSVAPDISVGDEILSRLSDLDADLLVMGAYGHSRMREFVFGGVTREIAAHMTVPTLFSH